MQQQKQFKVLLIGDSCVDEYVYGICERLNPEAPVPILHQKEIKTQKGMAWNVRENLLSFGLEVYMLTQEEDIIKRRYIDQRYNQQMLRVDIEDPIKPFDYDLPKDHFDALIISDYDKGFLTTQKIFDLVDWFDGPVFIDSKKTTLPVHKDNVFIKINEDEYKKLVHQESKNLIVTKGANGADYQGTNYPAIRCGVFDVCGAGDTFLASLVYFYLTKGSIETAIPFANKAASIAVSHFGTYVLNERDVYEICG
jgi:D-beta-D-heptose 7-phosphate kinase/D-beta-D-heptose 1-phosphate adenosyltransferase